MSLILVTGIIGSGKSEVIEILRCKYHKCIVCDDLAKNVIECRPKWRDVATSIFDAQKILNRNGGVNREFLREAFCNPRYSEQIKQYEDAMASAVVNEILEAQRLFPDDPIFVEAAFIPKFIERYGDKFEHTIFVTANKEIRRNRLVKRGVMPDHIAAFEKAQPVNMDNLTNNPTVVIIDNSGTKTELAIKVDSIVDSWPDCQTTTFMPNPHLYFK